MSAAAGRGEFINARNPVVARTRAEEALAVGDLPMAVAHLCDAVRLLTDEALRLREREIEALREALR